MEISTNSQILIEKLVKKIADGEYSIIKEKPNFKSRVEINDLSRIIQEYGETIIPLPDNAFDYIDIYPIEGKNKMYSIDIPIWTQEEGQSDLTLSLTLTDKEKILIEIDDLHVL